MKVLIISNYRGEFQARPEAYLVKGLAERNMEITVMTYEDAFYMPLLEDAGVRVIKRHPEKRLDKVFIAYLQEHLKEEQYDILHLFNNKAITNGLAAAKNLDVKISSYRSASVNMSRWNPVNYFKFYHPRIDLVICNSEEIKLKFDRAFFQKPNKSVTIFKGHDEAWYDSIPSVNIREELGIDQSVNVFVLLGNYRKMKGFESMIEAIRLLPEDFPGHFLFMGRDIEDRLHSSYHQLTEYQKEKVHFLGYRSDAHSIIKGADVFVLPSIDGESLTKAVIETIMIETPCILSDIAGNTPLYIKNKTAQIFTANDPKSLKDAIEQMLLKKAEWTQMAKDAKAHITIIMSVKKTVDAYEKAWHALLSNPR